MSFNSSESVSPQSIKQNERDSDLVKLGQIIATRIKELGLKKKSVAEKVGISTDYLWVLQRGKNPATGKPSKPSLEVLEHLSQVLRLDIGQLVELAGYDTVLQSAVTMSPGAEEKGGSFYGNPTLRRLAEKLSSPNVAPKYKELIESQINSLLDWIDDLGAFSEGESNE